MQQIALTYSSLVPLGLLLFGVLLGVVVARLYFSFGRSSKMSMDDLRTFKLTVDLSPEGIVITNNGPEIVYVNKAWERMTGYELSEVKGKNPSILKSGKTSSDVYTQMWTSLARGKVFTSNEIVNRKKNGEEYRENLSIHPVRVSGHEIFYVGFVRNVSEHAEYSNITSEFISLASHQLRTPLSVIDWYSESLMSSNVGNLNEKQHSYVEEIHNTNQHMLELVDMLLNTSQLELGTFSITPEPTDIVNLAKNVLEELKQTIEVKGLSVRTEFDDKIPTIRVDRNLLRIVLQNIISNAVRYTEPNDTIWFSMQHVSPGTHVKTHNIIVESILISVQDEGIGIPKEQQAYVFSKLFRADNAKKHHANGTGLGLYIVKSIINQMNSSIWFESDVGIGTTFYVVLPIRDIHPTRNISVVDHDD